MQPRKLISEAINGLDLRPREKVKLRLMVRLNRAAIEEEILEGAMEAGLIPAGSTAAILDGPAVGDPSGAINWAELIKFIMAILAMFA